MALVLFKVQESLVVHDLYFTVQYVFIMSYQEFDNIKLKSPTQMSITFFFTKVFRDSLRLHEDENRTEPVYCLLLIELVQMNQRTLHLHQTGENYLHQNLHKLLVLFKMLL